jgi:hypothetical protein
MNKLHQIMLKNFTIIFILFAFIAQTFNRALIVLDYYVHTAAFAKHCENKSKPAMHCNGKCQMRKQIKNEEKKDQQNPERKSENKNEVISSKSFFISYSYSPQQLKKCYNDRFIISLSIPQPSGIFHPPCALA